jgi:prepilin-type N-terminal cleavage/methylation domain-containing protein
MVIRRLLIDDEGFSLSELIIVLVLMGVVLAAIYGASQAMMAAGNVNTTQSVFSRESGESMRITEKYLMQLVQIETAGPYGITFRTDADLSGVLEKVRVTSTSGGILRFELWRNASASSGAADTSVNFSTHAMNQPRGVPMFSYFDKNGAAITDMTLAKTDSRTIHMDLLLEHDGAHHTATKTIFLRNLTE